MTEKQAMENLKSLFDWSKNGMPHIWTDFVNIVAIYTFGEQMHVDFSKYGFQEFEMFGKCLLIFENFGYTQIFEMTQKVEREVNV